MIKVKVYYGASLLLVNKFRSEKSCERYLKQLVKGREDALCSGLSVLKVITQKIK